MASPPEGVLALRDGRDTDEWMLWTRGDVGIIALLSD
jgi:hypothetical protein